MSFLLWPVGVQISDASGRPLDFSKGRWLDLDRGIVAASPLLHASVIKALEGL